MRTFTDAETEAWFSSLEKRMSSTEVALHTSDDYVIVVKANYKKHWSLPGGIIDAGETPRQGGVREVMEETGITVQPEQLQFVLVMTWVSDRAHSYQFVFEAQVEKSVLDTITLDDYELEDAAIVSRQQIIDGDRLYSESTRQWALGSTGYLEEHFELNR